MVPVSLLYPILGSHEHKYPDIEFSSIIQEGALDIGLSRIKKIHNKGFGQTVFVNLFAIANVFDFLQICGDMNTVAPVTDFPWFHDIDIFGAFLFPLIFGGLFPICNFLLLVVVKIKEILVLGVAFAFLDMEGHRNVLERVDGLVLAIVFEIVKHGFFVSKMIISIQMVMRLLNLAA